MAGAPSSLNILRPRVGVWLRIFAFIAIALAGLSASAEDEFKALLQRAFDLHQRGQYATALPILRRAYGLQSEDYFVNLLLGIDSLRTGGAKASVPFLRKASRLRPREEYPLAYLGEAYARQGLFADAAAAYIKAVGVSPRSMRLIRVPLRKIPVVLLS